MPYNPNVAVYFKVRVLCYCGHEDDRFSDYLNAKASVSATGNMPLNWRMAFDRGELVPLVEQCHKCQSEDYDKKQAFRTEHNLGGPL
jgi:hypothetical protein